MVVFEDVGIIDKLKIELKNPEGLWYAGWTMEKVSFYCYEFGKKWKAWVPGCKAEKRLKRNDSSGATKSRKASINLVSGICFAMHRFFFPYVIFNVNSFVRTTGKRNVQIRSVTVNLGIQSGIREIWRLKIRHDLPRKCQDLNHLSKDSGRTRQYKDSQALSYSVYLPGCHHRYISSVSLYRQKQT